MANIVKLKNKSRNSRSLSFTRCYRTRTTAEDKRLRFTSPKLPLATSFIRKTLYEIVPPPKKEYLKIEGELLLLSLTEARRCKTLLIFLKEAGKRDDT